MSRSRYALAVGGMTCAGCERIVESAVEAVDRVRDVDAAADADRVVIDGPRDAVGEVTAAIEAAGFDVER